MKLYQLFVEEEDAEQTQAHADALKKTGFWGKQGAGCIVLAQDTGNLLMPHRSRKVEQPHTWGTWGGAIDADENPKTAALREMEEESGLDPSLIVKVLPLFVFKDEASSFRYSNFLVVIKHEFKPTLNWETQGFKWAPFDDLPSPLHKGLQAVLADAKSVQTIKSQIKSKE